MQNYWYGLLLGIWLSLLTSCAVTPPDVPLCNEESINSAYCIYTISSREFEVNETRLYNGKTWWQIRPYMIQMPIDSWQEIKRFIIKVCKKYNCAGYNISSWERTVEVMDKRIAKP